MGTSWVSIQCPVAVSIIVSCVHGLYCVHGLRVSSLCHIARCQRQLPCTIFDRVGVINFLSIPLSPWSFFVLFTILSIWPLIWFELFACLIWAAIFHLTLAFVLFRLYLQFCHRLLCSPSFLAFFCRRHLPSVFLCLFSTCLVFRVSVYPSLLGRQRVVADFLCWVVSKSNRKVYLELRSFASSVASDCYFYSRVYFFTWFKHSNIVQKTRKVSVHTHIVV